MDTIKLIEILITKKQNPIPVVDAEKKILGIVSHSDLFKLLLPKDYVNYTAGKNSLRPIDRELAYVHKDLSSRFSYVSKARANIWVTVAITLMIVGFVMGIIFTADPNIF
jgi:CBS domain-containing protein